MEFRKTRNFSGVKPYGSILSQKYYKKSVITSARLHTRAYFRILVHHRPNKDKYQIWKIIYLAAKLALLGAKSRTHP